MKELYELAKGLQHSNVKEVSELAKGFLILHDEHDALYSKYVKQCAEHVLLKHEKVFQKLAAYDRGEE